MVAALDDRSKQVLKSLIQLHIATGEPVGSESLSRLMNRSLSPATIRNIMADLERTGYLAHPHTSAGRMPTDEGYRVYVDALMGQQALEPGEAAAIETELRPGEASPADVMEHACQLLSRLSRSMGFVLVPDLARASFRRLDLVRLPYPRILVVMVSQTGLVTHKVVEVDDQLTQDELQECANYLNVHFAGMPLTSVRTRLVELMAEEKALYDSMLKRVISVGREAFAPEGHEASVYVDGASNILERPELADFDRMRALFKTFEQKSRLVKIVSACLEEAGVRVVIGREIPDPDLKGMALVTAGFPVGSESGWAVGVMGTTRMEYAHVVSVVDHVARAISNALNDLHR